MKNKTAIIITGDEKGGVRAIKATRSELGKFNKTQKETKRDSQDLQNKIGSLIGKLTLVSGAVATGTSLISSLGLSIRANAIKEVGYLTAALDVNAQVLTEWGYATETVGFSTEKLADIFKDVQDKIGDFAATGGGEAKDIFDKLGLSIDKIKDLKPDEQLLAIASGLDSIENRSEKIFFLEAIANDASRLLPLLENNGAELRKLQGEAQDLGVSLSDSEVEKVKEVTDSFHRLGGFVEGTANQLTLTFAPAIVEVTDGITDSLIQINQLLKDMDASEAEHLVSLLASIAGGGAAYAVISRLNLNVLELGAAAAGTTKSLFSQLSGLKKTKIETNAYGQVIGKTTAKMKLATVATRTLTAATRVLLGPVGLAVAAGYALYEAFSPDEIDESTESMSELADEVIRINTNSAGFKQIAENTKELDQVADKVILLSKTIAIVEEGLKNMDPNTDAYRQSAEGFVALQVELKAAYDRQTELMESSNDAAEALLNFGDDAKNAGLELDVLETFSQSQEDALTRVIHRLDSSKKSWAQYKSSVEILQVALSAGRISADEFHSYLTKLSHELNGLKLAPKDVFEPEAFDEIIDKVDSFGESWSNSGSVIIETFGSISDVLDDYVNQLSAIDKLEEKTDKLRQKHGEDHAGYIEASQKLEEARVKANLSGLRSLTGAAASMFKENSKEREALHRLEMGFMVAEMAMSIEKSLLNATEAVTNQGGGDPYTAPARIASMIGIMAGILGAVGIAFGGSSGGGVSAAERQEQQGTGTVFGDSSAKSESINSSFERMVDLEADQYAELVKMNSNMRSLSSAITGVVESLVRGRDFSGDSYTGFLGTKSDTSTNGFFSKLGDDVLGGLGGLAGGLIDSIIGGISKTSYKLKDSGIQIAAQSLSSILDNGLSAVYYNTIERTKKRLWGLSKSTRTYNEYESLDNAILAQLSSIFGLITDTALSAAESLDFDAGLLQRRLESINLGLTSISFKDLSGDEIQAELEAVLSASSDQIAQQLVPELKNWQKVGEGAYETLTRVATEQAIFNQVLEQTGQSLSTLYNVADIDIAQNIIELAGGIEKLRDAASVYFSEFFTEAEQFEYLQEQLTAQFDALGFTLPKSKEEFRALVKSLDLMTESGQEMYAALLNLSPALAEFLKQLKEGFGDTTKAILEQVEELTGSLNKQLDDAFGDQARVNSLNTLISKERSLYDQRYRMYERELRLQTALGDLRNNLLLGDLSTLSPEEKLLEARRQLDEVTLENSESVISNYLRAARLMYGAGDGYSQAFEHAMQVLTDLQNIVLVEPEDNYLKSLEAERDALLAGIEAEKSMQQLEELFQQMMELGTLDRTALQGILEDLGSTPAVFDMLESAIFKLYEDTGAFDDIELSNLDKLLEAAFGLEQLDLSKLTDTEYASYIESIAENMSVLTGIDTATMTDWINNILQLDDPDLTASLLELVNTKNQLDIPEEQLGRLNDLVTVIEQLEFTDATALDVLAGAITTLVDTADIQFLRLQNTIEKLAEINVEPPTYVITDPPGGIDPIDIGPIGEPVFGDLNGLPTTNPSLDLDKDSDDDDSSTDDTRPPWSIPVGGPVLPVLGPIDIDFSDFKFSGFNQSPVLNAEVIEQLKKLQQSNDNVAQAVNRQTQAQTEQHLEAQRVNDEIAINTRGKTSSGSFGSVHP